MNKRWVILRHTLSKESLQGLHFDLLVEDDEIKFRYLNQWNTISKDALLEMLSQSGLPNNLYTKLRMRIV